MEQRRETGISHRSLAVTALYAVFRSQPVRDSGIWRAKIRLCNIVTSLGAGRFCNSPSTGIQPLLGRPFTGYEERTKQQVVLLSERVSPLKFGRNSETVGKQIRVGARSFAVVGMVSQRQAFPE